MASGSLRSALKHIPLLTLHLRGGDRATEGGGRGGASTDVGRSSIEPVASRGGPRQRLSLPPPLPPRMGWVTGKLEPPGGHLSARSRGIRPVGRGDSPVCDQGLPLSFGTGPHKLCSRYRLPWPSTASQNYRTTHRPLSLSSSPLPLTCG